MNAISHYSAIALGLAALFGAAGCIHLIGPRFLRDAYERWEYPQRLRLIVGLLEINAALLLADPSSRGWGITLAAIIDFGAVITLLNNRQYFQALPALAIMVALVPATVAVPRSYGIRFETTIEAAAPAPIDAAQFVQDGAKDGRAGG